MKLKAPENCDHINFPEGRLDVPDDGVLDCSGVDAETIATLQSHGFVELQEVESDAAETKQVEQSRTSPRNPAPNARPQLGVKHNGKR